MMNKDKQVRKIAQKVLKRYKLSLPIDFNEIIKTGYCVLKKEQMADFLDGYTDFNEKPPVIYINDSVSYEKRKRFTIAHDKMYPIE